MTSSDQRGDARVAYRVRARNTHTDSENRIHDDETAARFGFLGGLVPGVTVFAYMTVPVVERFSREWLDHGRISVRFHQPFYDGDEVIIRTEDEPGASPVRMKVTAERAGVVSASAVAFIEDARGREPRIEDYPRAQLPDLEARPDASRETLAPGSVLGTLAERLDAHDTAFLESVSERLPVYSGAGCRRAPGISFGARQPDIRPQFQARAVDSCGERGYQF